MIGWILFVALCVSVFNQAQKEKSLPPQYWKHEKKEIVLDSPKKSNKKRRRN